MISTFLKLGRTIELNLEPQTFDSSKGITEIELVLDIEDYWELSHLMREFRYAVESEQPTRRIWRRIRKIALPRILNERDRTWFFRQAR